jgi:hypothetical protein
MLREYSEKKVLKLYNPTKRKSTRFQMVRLKKKEINIGIIKRTTKTARSGVINQGLYILLFNSSSALKPGASSEAQARTSRSGWFLAPFKISTSREY